MIDQSEHNSEKGPQNQPLPVRVFSDARQASASVAAEIAALIRSKANVGERAVLGLATGSTPRLVYAELIRLHLEEGLSFHNVLTFNLDEYYPMKPDSPQSYVRFMKEQLFDFIDIPDQAIHIPDGTIPPEHVHDFCAAYEAKIKQAGGLDIQVLGIGRTGHIGFNEPGSPETSVTRMVHLDPLTRNDAASDFMGLDKVPVQAITMGIGTIMKARKIILMAWGEAKASIIKKTVEGKISDLIPATYLKKHSNVQIILDKASSVELTEVKNNS